jgi:tetratricopeptide (TPR) repeat protein
MERSALREAVTAFEQALVALEHLPESPATSEQAIDLRFDLRNALVPLGEHGRILDHLRPARALAESLDDRRRLGQVDAYMAASLWQLGDPERGLASGQRALAIATALGEAGLRVAADGIVGELYLWGLSDYRCAAERFRRNVETAPGGSRKEPFAVAAVPSVANRANLAWCLAELGMFAEGRVHGEDALQLAELVDHRYSLARACAAVGHAFLCQGDLPQTVRFLERALALSEAMNFPTTIRLCAGRLGVAYALAGRFAEAQLQLERARENLAAVTQTILYPLYALPLAEGYLLIDCMTEAVSLAARALEIAQTHQAGGYQADALRLLGEIAMRQESPDVAQADAHYRGAVALAEGLGRRPLVAHCHLGLGELHRRTGRRGQAEDHVTAAMKMYREMDMSFWVEKAQARLTQ